MENNNDLYNAEELDLLNKLSIISKEFQDKYNEEKEMDEDPEK